MKRIFGEILNQIKADGENKRILWVKRQAAKMSNGMIDPVVRSVSATIGNQRDSSTDKLHSSYLSLITEKVFFIKDKYTGMTLVHYACEYGCSRFLKALCKALGTQSFVSMVC